MLRLKNPAAQPPTTSEENLMKQHGLTFVSWERGQLATAAARQSFDHMLATGVNAVAFVPTVYQATAGDVSINDTTPKTSADAEIAQLIAEAKARGRYVMVKPHVDLSHDDAHWRGDIGQDFTDAMWVEWFGNYTRIIVRYAELAQRHGANLFCVGTELKSASSRAEQWRALVRAVRAVFSGELVYASNHDETGITWWDALDFIGIDAYFSLGDRPGDVGQIKRWWRQTGDVERLERLSRQVGRPVIFTEIGYRNIAGANINPAEWHNHAIPGPADQANCYQAALDIFAGQPWFAGMYWWNWLADPNQGGLANTDYTPFGKPAAGVLRKFNGQA
jgi:hypothetical protein